jgi:dTDP-4-dehydrorhamnose reductase
MHILLLGNTGQLGWELERCLAPLGVVEAVDYPQINLVEINAVRTLVRSIRPSIILNATAYTAVDRAESEADLVMSINATAPGVLAEEAANLGAALIHFSTDYVFDGKKNEPYIETDAPNPLGMYGSSKLEGERAVESAGDAYLILRTAWVYSLRRDSFVTKVLGWSRSQSALKLVTDQISNPTWARMLAQVTSLMIARAGDDPTDWVRQHKGVYHLAGDGYASRYEFGKKVLEYDPRRSEQTIAEIQPGLTSEFPSPAERPLFSVLNCEKFKHTFGLSLPAWESALYLALQG